MYKSLLPLNEEDIFENISLVVVKMKSGTMKVVNIKFPQIKYQIIINSENAKLCIKVEDT